MKSLKSLMIALCAASLMGLFVITAPGCQSTSARNDLLIDIAVSQGVIRYIEAGSTPMENAARRERLIAALGVARQFVSSDTSPVGSDWANQFVMLMDWDALSVSDQVLISQVITLVQQEIELRTANEAELKVSLSRLIDVAINTAGQL